jgi:hypothetical protein
MSAGKTSNGTNGGQKNFEWQKTPKGKMLNGKLMMKEHKVKSSKRPMGQNVEWEILKNGNNVECYTYSITLMPNGT